MNHTAQTEAHRPTKRSSAAHTAAEAERANREARRTWVIMKDAMETGRTWLVTKEGLRLEIGKFVLRRETTELREGEILFVAISQETGEIRKYSTRYLDNIRFIGNADYVLNNRERTLYLTYERTGSSPTSWRELDRREAGN